MVAVDALNGDAKRVNLSSDAGINDNPWLKYKKCQPTSLELTTVAPSPVTSSSTSSFRVRTSKGLEGRSLSKESEAHIIVNEFFQSSPIEDKVESDV